MKLWMNFGNFLPLETSHAQPRTAPHCASVRPTVAHVLHWIATGSQRHAAGPSMHAVSVRLAPQDAHSAASASQPQPSDEAQAELAGGNGDDDGGDQTPLGSRFDLPSAAMGVGSAARAGAESPASPTGLDPSGFHELRQLAATEASERRGDADRPPVSLEERGAREMQRGRRRSQAVLALLARNIDRERGRSDSATIDV